MEVLNTPESQSKLAQALQQMSAALEILDDLDAPGEVGSHLDLAICRLEQHLGLDSPATTGAGALFVSLEEELLAIPMTSQLQCAWNSHQSDTVPGSDTPAPAGSGVDDSSPLLG